MAIIKQETTSIADLKEIFKNRLNSRFELPVEPSAILITKESLLRLFILSFPFLSQRQILDYSSHRGDLDYCHCWKNSQAHIFSLVVPPSLSSCDIVKVSILIFFPDEVNEVLLIFLLKYRVSDSMFPTKIRSVMLELNLSIKMRYM